MILTCSVGLEVDEIVFIVAENFQLSIFNYQLGLFLNFQNLQYCLILA